MALACGEWDVDYMLRRMPAGLFTEWRSYAELDPWGTEGILLGNAIVASSILNTNRRKGASAISPTDLMPDFLAAAKRALASASQPAQTMQEQIAIVEQLNAYFGGKDLRNHG